MTLGEIIRDARKKAGLTQKQLANKLGVSAVNISQLENGAREPKLETLGKIALALDTTVSEMINNDWSVVIDQPDRDFELVQDAITGAGFVLEATGCGEGPDADGDHYYVWPKDDENPEETRKEYVFRDLLQLVKSIERDADARRLDYIRRRLEAEFL